MVAKVPSNGVNLTDFTISGTTPFLTIGDAGAEDAGIIFDGNAQDFYIGLDDSADDLVIGVGSALGTTTALSVDENRVITVASGAKITYGDGGTTSRLMFDLWVLETSITTGGSYNATISANLARSDESGTDSIVGTGMSESSGIFTFPSTGIYLVTANASFYRSGADSNYNSVRIEVTTDNSSYNVLAEAWDYVPDNASSYGHTISSCLVDVTNTTNVKVRFNARTEANAVVYGNNASVSTHFQFQRIGDT
jgi:hypothetical protein